MRLVSPLAFLAAVIVTAPVLAAVQTIGVGASYSTAPYTYDFGGGSSITFTNTGDFFNPAAVSTGGTLQIASLGAPLYNPPQPTSYYTNRGGSFGPDVLATFVSYATPATVPYSISEGLVGLRFDLGKGYQYGYADIAGTTLYGVRFETTPGAGLALGAVPEPAAWVLLIGGFAMTGAAMRRHRKQQIAFAG